MKELTILQGNVIDRLKDIPDSSIQTVVTSPPYWGLRDYGTESQIWGGDEKCAHDWVENTYQRRSNDEGAPGRMQENNVGGSGREKPINYSLCRKCGAWLGSLGLEPTPEMFVEHLVLVFREVRRTLRDDGILWLNLGDSYWGGKGSSSQSWASKHPDRQTLEREHHHITPAMGETRPQDGTHPLIKPKDLVGIPWSVALALRNDGWYLRSDCIWSKPDGMPESVRDRPTRSHEYLFLLSKSSYYYYDQDAIREPHKESAKQRAMRGSKDNTKYADGSYLPDKNPHSLQASSRENIGYEDMNEKIEAGETTLHPMGANKRTVWTIATHSFSEAHFAVFPPKLVEPCILAGSNRQACPHCGAPWERNVERVVVEPLEAKPYCGQGQLRAGGMSPGGQGTYGTSLAQTDKIHRLSYGFVPGCDCENNDGSGKCFVLDPFAGSGTTGIVAVENGRGFVGIELNPDYCKMIERRLKEIQVSLFDV